MNKAIIAQSLATVIGNLLENNGLLDDKQYLGCALDAKGCPFLIRDNHTPVSFDVDATGSVVFTGQKLKDAVKYKRDVTREERDVFNEYCAAQGLYNQFYFHCSSMEKAMTIATLANAAQQFQQQGEGASREELVAGTVKATLNNFAAAVEHIDPQLLKDDDVLVQAVLDAGMTPVNEQGEPIIRKVEAAPNAGFNEMSKDAPVDKHAQTEQLVTLMKQRDDLSPVEKELVVRLERMIAHDRAREARIEQIKTNPQNSVEHSIGHLLRGPFVARWLEQSL